MFDTILNIVSTLLWFLAILMFSQLIAICYVAFKNRKKEKGI